jgi:hypothetical protein
LHQKCAKKGVQNHRRFLNFPDLPDGVLGVSKIEALLQRNNATFLPNFLPIFHKNADFP